MISHSKNILTRKNKAKNLKEKLYFVEKSLELEYLV